MFFTERRIFEARPAEPNDRTQLRNPNSLASYSRITSLAPSVLKSRFVLQEQLGSGGMGTVFRAKDLRKVGVQDSQSFLAIKVLNRQFREHPDASVAFQNEAIKSQSLSHPNIVKIYDFDKDGDTPFMTMELFRGTELTDLLSRHHRGLPKSRAWRLIHGFCSALKYAHAKGVIHADLKPANLFVTDDGQLKVFDFGVACSAPSSVSNGVFQVQGDAQDAAFDSGKLRALTPAFASRALLDGSAASTSDDLFAAALVIYQILTGKHPYNRVPANQIYAREIAVKRPSQLSTRRWRILFQAMALEERQRLGSVADLQTALFEKPFSPIRSLSSDG